MAVGSIIQFPEGVGAAQYDAVTEKFDLKGNPPEGMILHCAGEVKGRFQVFNVWESEEHARRFEEERLRPAQIAVMGEEAYAALPDADRPQVSLHNYLIP